MTEVLVHGHIVIASWSSLEGGRELHIGAAIARAVSERGRPVVHVASVPASLDLATHQRVKVALEALLRRCESVHAVFDTVPPALWREPTRVQVHRGTEELLRAIEGETKREVFEGLCLAANKGVVRSPPAPPSVPRLRAAGWR